MRISAGKLASLKLLLGFNGKPITSKAYVRQFISVPGRFTSYNYPEAIKHTKLGRCVDLAEVEEWNKTILSTLKKTITNTLWKI